jgi:ABC-type sugar transport system substrate-binding protein
MRIIFFVMLFAISLPTAALNLKVTVILPDKGQNIFWELIRDVTRVAANSLHIELEIINSAGNRFDSKTIIDELVERKIKPDYLIFFPFLGNTLTVFKQLDKAKIKFITLEQTFGSDVGKPQEKFKHWLGQINYDNKGAGEMLLNAFKKTHFNQSTDTALYVIGIGGDFDSVSLNRQWILEQNLSSHDEKDVVVNQVFQMHWDPTRVQQNFSLMLERYPSTNAYWCASDKMALEILKQSQKLGLKNLIIGGFDWMPNALMKIKSGEMTASMGGHFLMTGDALVKIVDHHNGIDRFLNEPLLNSYELIDIDNVDKYQPFLTGKYWKQADFSKYLSTSQEQSPRRLNIENLISDAQQQNKLKGHIPSSVH